MTKRWGDRVLQELKALEQPWSLFKKGKISYDDIYDRVVRKALLDGARDTKILHARARRATRLGSRSKCPGHGL